jgi:hypothetical protein
MCRNSSTFSTYAGGTVMALTIADARRLANEGYGWNDLMVKLGMG